MSNGDPIRVKCHKCGAMAIVTYVNIPAARFDPDGRPLTPSDWTHAIRCPACGDREQLSVPDGRRVGN
jgi:hypothetical protein